jgi:hypothetical protein
MGAGTYAPVSSPTRETHAVDVGATSGAATNGITFGKGGNDFEPARAGSLSNTRDNITTSTKVATSVITNTSIGMFARIYLVVPVFLTECYIRIRLLWMRDRLLRASNHGLVQIQNALHVKTDHIPGHG